MAKRYDCDHELGLTREERACLSGFTYRAVAALAHLREAWCNGDTDNRFAVEQALRQLLAGHSLKNVRAICKKVLGHGLDDPTQLWIGAGFL